MNVGSVIRSGVASAISGLVVGYLWEAFVPIYVGLLNWPSWTTGMLLGIVSLVGAAFALSDLWKHSLAFAVCFGAGSLFVSIPMGDYWGFAVPIIVIVARVVKRIVV